MLPIEVTDSELVLDVAGAFRLVGTGPPFGGMGPGVGAVMAGRRRIECSSDGHGRLNLAAKLVFRPYARKEDDDRMVIS